MVTDWVDEVVPDCGCIVWHTCDRQNSTENGTDLPPFVEVDGIEWCATHDDFAIEGYDWSDVCHGQYMDGGEADECDLRPLFRSAP